MNWTDQQASAVATGKPMPKARGRVGQQQRGTMNRTEAAFAAHLEMQKRIGEIAAFWFEAVTIRLASDCRYSPDFMVLRSDGLIQLFEVKGRSSDGDKPRIEDDALIKLKVTAEAFPFPLIIVWPSVDGAWGCREL